MNNNAIYSEIKNSKKRFKIVKNGDVQRGFASRTVVFDERVIPRPIFEVVRQGYISQQGTIQMVLSDSDWIVTSEREYPDNQISFMQNGEIKFEGSSWALWGGKVPINLPEWAKDFLDDLEGAPKASHLPIWEEGDQSYAEWLKLGKLISFGKIYGVKFSLKEAMRTPKKFINLWPQSLDFDPDEFVGEIRNEINQGINIHQKLQWLGVNEGKARLINVPIYDGYYRPNQKGIPNWRDYEFLVKLLYGAIISENKEGIASYGLSIDVYNTK